MTKLFHCDKRTSNTMCCSKLATFKVQLKTKSDKVVNAYRCDEHHKVATQNKTVISSEIFSQTNELYEVNKFLKSLINKTIFSKKHRCEVLVKYLKPNASVMCLSDNGKYLLVYHYQVETI